MAKPGKVIITETYAVIECNLTTKSFVIWSNGYREDYAAIVAAALNEENKDSNLRYSVIRY